MNKRKVQLWRFVDADDNPVPKLPTSALHRLLIKADAADQDLTYVDRHGFRTQLQPVNGAKPHVLLHRLRNTDLPSERRNGRIVALDPNVQELAEGSHARFLNGNLVAFIGNGISPRPSRLAEWIRNRIGWDVWLQPVYRHDLGNVLTHIRKVSNITLGVSAEEVARLDMQGFFEGDDDPLTVLRFAQQFQQGGNIRMEWSVGLGKNHDQNFFQQLIQRLSRADVKDFNVAKAKVYLDDGDSIPLDFIHDKVVVEVEIEERATRQRTLPDDVARKAMKDAWDHFKNQENILKHLPVSDESPLDLPSDLIPNAADDSTDADA